MTDVTRRSDHYFIDCLRDVLGLKPIAGAHKKERYRFAKRKREVVGPEPYKLNIKGISGDGTIRGIDRRNIMHARAADLEWNDAQP